MNRSPRTLLATATAALVAVAAASPAVAAPIPVKDGTANWWQANVYQALPARTFLGHVTRPGQAMMGRSNGTVLASAGATATHPDGSTVDGARPEADALMTPDRIYTFHYGVDGGSFDPIAKTADVTTKGTVSFTQYPALPTPPQVITVDNPRIVLSGDGTGAVYASGNTSTAGASFTADTPLFTLDASAATFRAVGGGSYVIGNLVPALAKVDVFGAAGQYPIGAGPERNPNTWGGFALAVDTVAADEPVIIEKTVETVVEKIVEKPVAAAAAKLVVLDRAITKTAFRGAKGKAVRVQVRKRGQWTVLGEGFAQGRLLTLMLPEGTKLNGDYVLRRVGGSSKLPKSVVVTTQDAKAKQSKRSSR